MADMEEPLIYVGEFVFCLLVFLFVFVYFDITKYMLQTPEEFWGDKQEEKTAGKLYFLY